MRRNLPRSAALFGFALLLLLGLPAQAKDWSTYHGGVSRTGTTGEKVPLPFDGAGAWQFTIAGNPVIASSATVVNNRVTFGARNGHVYCVRARTDSGGAGGTQVWDFQTTGSVDGSVTCHRGRVFFGSSDGYVYCVRATDGQQVWRSFHGGTQLSTPAVDDDVVVFAVGDPSNEIRAYDTEVGCFLWSYNSGQISYTSPVLVSGAGVVVGGSDNGKLFALDKTNGPDSSGNPLWSVSTNGGVFLSSPAYDSTSNTVYFLAGDHDRNLYRVAIGDDPTTGGLETAGQIVFKAAPFARGITQAALLAGATSLTLDSVDGFLDPAHFSGAAQWARLVDGVSSDEFWYSSLDTATNTLSGLVQDSVLNDSAANSPGAAGLAFAHATGKAVHNFQNYSGSVVTKPSSDGSSTPPPGTSGKPIVPGGGGSGGAGGAGGAPAPPTSADGPYTPRTPVPAGVYDELMRYPPEIWPTIIDGWQAGSGQDLNWLREAMLSGGADGNLQKVGGFSSGDSVTFNIVKTSSPVLAGGRVYLVQRESGATEEYQLHVVDALTGVRQWSYAQTASTRIELESTAPTPAVTPLDGASGPMVYVAWGNNLMAFDETQAVSSRRVSPATFYKTGTASVVTTGPTVTGAGTTWTSLPNPAVTPLWLVAADGRVYSVASIATNTSLTLAVTPSVAASGAYVITSAQPLDGSVHGSTTVADGQVFAGTFNGSMYAFQSANHAPEPPPALTPGEPVSSMVMSLQTSPNPVSVSWDMGAAYDADAGDPNSSLRATVQVAYAPMGTPAPSLEDIVGEFEQHLVSSQGGTTMAGDDFYTFPGTVPVNTHVFVRVRFEDARGAQSAWSGIESFWVSQDTSPPQPPASVSAVPGDGTVQLFWTASPSPGVIGYNVYGREVGAPGYEGPSSFALVYDASFTTLPATATALVNGTTYEFSVRAVSQGEVESDDAAVTVTPNTAVSIGGTAQPSLAAALGAALPGETITLGVGTFDVAGGITLPAGVSIRGYGPGFTILRGNGTGPVIGVAGTTADPLVTIAMLTVREGSVGIDANAANVRVRNVVVCRNSSSADTDGAVMADNGGEIEIVNVTVIHNNSHGVRSEATTTTVRNTEVCWNNRYGINVVSGSGTVRFGDVFGNVAGAYNGVNPAAADENLALMPIYLDKLNDDYRVEPDSWTVDSPTVDAGQPTSDATGPNAAVYTDFTGEPSPNGSRVNQGAFGNTEWAALSVGPPVGGTVSDGTGADIDTQSDATTADANWSGFTAGQGIDTGAFPLTYEWAIGTTSGGEQIQAYTAVGGTASASANDLALVMGVTYYVSVRATNVAGLSAVVSSDGVEVPVPSDGSVTGGINASGGTLTVDGSTPAIGNSSITVPSGTTFLLSGGAPTASITLTLTNAASSIDAGLWAVGSPLAVQPSDLAFSSPVTVKVPYSAVSIPTGLLPADIVVVHEDATGMLSMLTVTSVDSGTSTVTVSTSGTGTFEAFVVYADGNSDGTPDPIVAEVVDPAGGTVDAPVVTPTIGGSKVDVPAGTTFTEPGEAPATSVIITIRQGTSITNGASNMNAVGPAVTFEPEGMTFSVAVTVTVPYTASSIPGGRTPAEIRVYKRDNAAMTVTLLTPTAVDTTAHTVTVSTTSFSTFQAFVEAPATSSGSSSSGSSSSSGGSSSGSSGSGSGSSGGSSGGGGGGGCFIDAVGGGGR